MTKDTRIWIATYGDSSDTTVVGLCYSVPKIQRNKEEEEEEEEEEGDEFPVMELSPSLLPVIRVKIQNRTCLRRQSEDKYEDDDKG